MSELTYGREYIKTSLNNNKPLAINKNVVIAKVLDTDDPKNGGRIKVFIDGIDQVTTPVTSLPYAYPLMSRVLHVMPKVGEAVLILMADIKVDKQDQLTGNRFWIGPLLTNYEFINYDNTDVTALLTTKNTYAINRNITKDPLQGSKSQNRKSDEINIFPVDTNTPPQRESNLDDVTIVGRNNTDITQSENKITLRAGKHKKDKPTNFNNINPVYSVLEFIRENENEKEKNSYSLTVGDEIFLISHKGKYSFKKILTKDDIDSMRQNSQSMLYGELTVSYLKTLTEVFLNHIHTHPQETPTYKDGKRGRIDELREQLKNIENLLAKNVKIN